MQAYTTHGLLAASVIIAKRTVWQNAQRCSVQLATKCLPEAVLLTNHVVFCLIKSQWATGTTIGIFSHLIDRARRARSGVAIGEIGNL